MEVRLDKWLKVTRIFKTRSQASRAIELNRIRVNDQPVKAHRQVHVNDRIVVRYGDDWERILIVRDLRDKPVSKAEARTLFEDVSPPRPRLDLLERLMRSPAARREKGSGRPTKRDRRAIDKWEEKKDA